MDFAPAGAPGLLAEDARTFLCGPRPGPGSSKDWELAGLIVERECTFLTNNRADFPARYRRTPLHADLVIIVPNVKPALQPQRFKAALRFAGERDLVNTVIEAGYLDEEIECLHYPFRLG